MLKLKIGENKNNIIDLKARKKKKLEQGLEPLTSRL